MAAAVDVGLGPPSGVYPRRPWVVRMQWHDLLFCHWAVEPRKVEPLVPKGFPLHLAHGEAWVSTVAFHMSDVGLRGAVGVPGHRAFTELNLRTYVEHDGLAGIHFLSIDATSKLMVRFLRTFFHLPYVDAEARVRGDRHIDYQVRRLEGPQLFDATATPVGDPKRCGSSLDRFLTERYALFTRSKDGRLYRGMVRHDPYLVQPVDVVVRSNTFLDGFGVSGRHPHRALFSRHVDCVAWTVDGVAPAGPGEPP